MENTLWPEKILPVEQCDTSDNQLELNNSNLVFIYAKFYLTYRYLLKPLLLYSSYIVYISIIHEYTLVRVYVYKYVRMYICIYVGTSTERSQEAHTTGLKEQLNRILHMLGSVGGISKYGHSLHYKHDILHRMLVSLNSRFRLWVWQCKLHEHCFIFLVWLATEIFAQWAEVNTVPFPCH